MDQPVAFHTYKIYKLNQNVKAIQYMSFILRKSFIRLEIFQYYIR